MTTEPSPAEQAEWCRLAQGGDRAAADSLYRSVESLIAMMANKIASKSGMPHVAEDLVSLASERFMMVVRTAKPTVPFAKYLALCLRRTFADYLTKEMDRRSKEYIIQDDDGIDIDHEATPVESPEALAVIAALKILSPIERRLSPLLYLGEGKNEQHPLISHIASTLKCTKEDIFNDFAHTRKKMRKWMANRGGRPKDKRAAEIVRVAMKLRASGLPWSLIAIQINAELERSYTALSLRILVLRKNPPKSERI